MDQPPSTTLHHPTCSWPSCALSQEKPCEDPTRAAAGTGVRATRLDVRELDKGVRVLFAKGLANSTQRTYSAGQKRYLTFCEAGNFTPVPATERLLCRFVTFLTKEGLKLRTIKVYLSVVRFLHIAEARTDPFLPTQPWLHYILQGIKRAEAEKRVEKRARLHISPNILRKIKGVWEASASEPDIIMLWAACCLEVFGFLRSGEMTEPTTGITIKPVTSLLRTLRWTTQLNQRQYEYG